MINRLIRLASVDKGEMDYPKSMARAGAVKLTIFAIFRLLACANVESSRVRDRV